MSKLNLKKLKIGVIMGGLSSEREISLLTGKSIEKTLRENGHKVTGLDINIRSFKNVIDAKIDVAVIALHGTYGEDGVTQGILEFLGIPYTGSGVLASALGMNKIMAKQIFDANNIPNAEWTVVRDEKELKNVKIPYPLVFKPSEEGSSVGVAIVRTKKDSVKAYKKAAKYGNAVLVEKYIKGVEISVPVLGSDTVLPIIEIVPANEFYDYESKYTAGKSQHIIPARISKKAYKNACETALKVHNCLMCRDLSRVDMIVTGDKVSVIEINTLPGMTSLSLYPDAARAVESVFMSSL